MGWFDKLLGGGALPYDGDDGPDDGLPFNAYGDYEEELPEEGGSEGAMLDDEDSGPEGVEFGLDEGDYDDDPDYEEW